MGFNTFAVGLGAIFYRQNPTQGALARPWALDWNCVAVRKNATSKLMLRVLIQPVYGVVSVDNFASAVFACYGRPHKIGVDCQIFIS